MASGLAEDPRFELIPLTMEDMSNVNPVPVFTVVDEVVV